MDFGGTRRAENGKGMSTRRRSSRSFLRLKLKAPFSRLGNTKHLVFPRLETLVTSLFSVVLNAVNDLSVNLLLVLFAITADLRAQVARQQLLPFNLVAYSSLEGVCLKLFLFC